MAVTTDSTITRIGADTREYFFGTLIDQVFDRIPLIYKLRRMKRVIVRGGRELKWPVSYGKNTQSQIYEPGDPLYASTETKRTLATAGWTYMTIPIMYDVEDEVANDGNEVITDTIKAEVSSAQESFMDQLSQTFYGNYGVLDSTTVSAPTTGKPYSIPSALWFYTNGGTGATNFDGGLDTYGGITRSAVGDWWLGNTGTAPTHYAQTEVDVSPETWDYAVLSCMKKRGSRSNLLAVCGPTLWAKWKSWARTENRGNEQKGMLAKVGFTAFTIDDIELVLDDNCPDNYFYMLDLSTWKWFINARRNFKMTPFVWQAQTANGADEYLARILLAHNLVCTKPCNNYFTANMV